MRRKRKKISSKLGFIFIILILSLACVSISYSAWTDTVYIKGRIKMGHWTPCIKINKTLDREGCSGDLHLTIYVSNNGSTNITSVNVTDSIGIKAIPTPGTISPSKGSVSWINTTVIDGIYNNLTWYIGMLEPGETVSLSMCITTLSCDEEDYVDAQVQSPPESPPRYHVTRIIHDPPGWTEDVYYTVEYIHGGRGIKFEDARDAPIGGNENLLGENGDDWHHETDTFVITVLNGSDRVNVTVKAGGGGGHGGGGVTGTLNGEGDYITIDGFNVTLKILKIIDLGGGLREYTITATSENKSHALSHISFDFGRTCRIKINEGAKATAVAEWVIFCDRPLEATTEGIAITIDEYGNVITPLPYYTPWAEDCCND